MMQEVAPEVLVVGATGTVGRAVLAALRARGARARALVRGSGTASPGQIPGAQVVHGDLRDPLAVTEALRGVSAAFYVSPHEPDEETIAETFISACERAELRLVFVGVHVDGATRLSRALRRFLFGRWLSHYAPKFRIAERARTSKASPVVLMPTNFYQNDELFRDELLDGAFVQPLARPINRVDARDIADAAARACLDRALAAGAYPVVGPESLDGAACAAAWGRALGRPVEYRDDPARLRAALERELRGKKLEDFLASYSAIRKLELPTSAEQLARTTALLGRAPTPYSTYVQAVASRFRKNDPSAVGASDGERSVHEMLCSPE